LFNTSHYTDCIWKKFGSIVKHEGTLLEKHTGKNLDQCKQICDELISQGCWSVSHTEESGKCWLYDKTLTGSETLSNLSDVDSRVNDYTSYRDCNSGKYQPNYGINNINFTHCFYIKFNIWFLKYRFPVSIIMIITEKAFTRIDNTICSKSHLMAEYTTIQEAQSACLDNSTCSTVYDGLCDNVRYWTCSGKPKPSSKGSCTWTSNETILPT
jgi:hypothetical protein